jgi:transposase
MEEDIELVNGIIYVHTNTVNGHQYVGKTKRTLKRRMGSDFSRYCIYNNNGTPTKFHAALLKYGTEKFTTDIIFEGQVSPEVLNSFEKLFIWEYDTYKNGYNGTTGGENPEYCDESNKKISDAHLNGNPKATKEELIELYINSWLTTYEIAVIFNVAQCTICRWIKEYGIPVRSPTEGRLNGNHKATKEELIDLYVSQGLTTTEIGEIFKVSHVTIGNWLREYDISIRTPSESHPKVNLNATKEELIDLYVRQGLVMEEIGKILNVSATTIRNRLIENKIPIRSRLESRQRSLSKDKE